MGHAINNNNNIKVAVYEQHFQCSKRLRQSFTQLRQSLLILITSIS